MQLSNLICASVQLEKDDFLFLKVMRPVIKLNFAHFFMLAMVADFQVARNRQLSLKMTSGYFVTANHCQCK